MIHIELDDKTARELVATAAAHGMTVEEFVRSKVLAASQPPNGAPGDPVLGTMAAEADLLDEVISDVYSAREIQPLRLESDGQGSS